MSLLSSIVDLVKRAFTGESERKPEVRPSRTVIQETPWPRVVRTPGTTVSPYPYGDEPRAREKVDAPKPKPIDLKKDPLHRRIMHYWMLLEMAIEIDVPRDSYEKFFEGNALRMKYGKKNIDAFLTALDKEWARKKADYEAKKKAYEAYKASQSKGYNGFGKRGKQKAVFPPKEPEILIVVTYGLIRHFDLLKDLYKESDLILEDDGHQSMLLTSVIKFKGKYDVKKETSFKHLFSLKSGTTQLSPFVFLLSENHVNALKSGDPYQLFEALKRASELESDFELNLKPRIPKKEEDEEDEKEEEEPVFTLDKIDELGMVLLSDLFLTYSHP